MEKERFEKENQVIQQCASIAATIQNKKWTKKTKRNRLIKGFLITEESYLHVLDSLVPRLVVFCRENRKEPGVADWICKLLESIQKVKNISRALFEEIMQSRKSIAENTDLYKLPLASLLLSRIQYLKLYKVYADDFRTYYSKIIEYNQDPFWSKIDGFFQTHSKGREGVSCFRKMNLETVLKLPLQRVIKYDLLMQKLVVATRKKDEDKTIVKEASKQIHEIRAFCEKMLIGREMFVKI